MLENFGFFFILILLAAAVLRQDTLFVLLYLVAGVFLAGRWWGRHAIETLVVARSFPDRVFLGEDIPVEIDIRQPGWLPLVWLRVYDQLPPGLGAEGNTRQVTSLAPKGHSQMSYRIYASRRGYYTLGPLRLASGDPFGISGEYTAESAAAPLIIYPRVVMLNSFGLPSRSPMGTLRHHLPIYEDPTRVLSKRDYAAGDSLRRIDWKSSAAVGRLQVKHYEPSIALETMLMLNLNALEYELRTRFEAPELGIVVAASIANWVVTHQQTVGLCTNGHDPLSEAPDQPVAGAAGRPSRLQTASPLMLGRGHQHLMRLLEVLARIAPITELPPEASPQPLSFLSMVHQQRANLPWGTTVVLLTGRADEDLFDEIFLMRRAGLNPVLVLLGVVPGLSDMRQKAEFFKIPFYHVLNELDLDQWRAAGRGAAVSRLEAVR